ncbi:hypothetical protein GIB67_019796 [Kingdonia uniflora]|uniref:Uncharacterized protein n=1 Tax=Kingdonia uniflora TaxID=39325 RepID=A0A7J7MKF8_9MAGN|nr:hypothetical protein GIB67_019796 [Kingdonia uniflora]
MRSKNPKPSSKFVISSSSEESSSSDRTMDDSVVIGTVTVDNLTVSVGLHAGNETGLFLRLWFRTLVRQSGNIKHYQVPSLDRWKRSMDIRDDIDIVYYNGTGAEGVNLEAAEQKALDLATRDPICLDTQIRSSISQKLAAANRGELVRQHDAEKAALREQFEQEKVLQREHFEKEKALQKDKFEKEAAATKQEVEDEVKKVVDIAVASQNKLIQDFHFWGLGKEDVDLALTGKYGEIVFPGDDASPVAEQTPAPPVADDPTKEEVVHLRGKVIEMEKALSRARDFINRTQQGQKAMRILFFNIKKKDRMIHAQLEIDLRHACDELEWCKGHNGCLEKKKVECARLLQSSEKRVTLLEAHLLDTQQRLQVSQSRLQKKITPKRGKRAINTNHERQIANVTAFYGGELGRVENEFRRYISSCGKDVEVENDKVENKWLAKGNEGGGALTSKLRAEESEEEEVEDLLPRTRHKARPQEVEDKEHDKLAALSASNEKLSAKLQQYSLAVERPTLLNSKLESEILELQSRLNAMTAELSCKDEDILTANNESEMWKESLKKKKLETNGCESTDSEIRYMRGRLKKLNWDLREARDSCQRKNDHAKTHEEACSKRDRELIEAINKYNSRIADLDRDKQALVLECMQGNKVFEELHVKYKESQRMMDAAEAEINYSRERNFEQSESILAATTEYVTEYDLQLARLSYIDNLMPRVMELLNAPSTVVDAVIPFPVLLSSGLGESLNVVRPIRE